jgi:DNA polymerase I-like protein with 3'-5' exonuclease and polymerase domains
VKGSSYPLTLTGSVGEYRVHLRRYVVTGAQIKTQLEVWNGALLVADTITLGRAAGRLRLLKQAGKRCTMTSEDRSALDLELARLGSVVEEDFRRRQERGRQERTGAQGPAGDSEEGEQAPPAGEAPPTPEPSPDDEEQTERVSQATQLVELAGGWDLFHDNDGTAYATAMIEGHRQTYRLAGPTGRRLLARAYYRRYEKVPRAQALADALVALAGRALYDGAEHGIGVRLAECAGTIWLDLGDAEWRAVEITATGWRVVASTEVPVRFIRAKGMQALPAPARGGSIKDLRKFLNAKDDTAWYLIVAWLLTALRPTGPYLVLVFTGQQGTGKTTAGELLRALVDPNRAPLRSEPREERDLAIAASNSWLVAFDNLSRLPDWLSDAISRLSTGGGFATRKLYEDDEEVIFDYQRPCILTSIEDVITRGDLLDRSVLVELEPITKEDRRSVQKLWADFTAARPAILGAVLDVVAGALAALPTTHLTELQRMADAALWVAAAEGALGWVAGSFITAYETNQRAASGLALEASILLAPLRTLLEASPDGRWDGMASALLRALSSLVDDPTRKEKGWPKQANALSGMLKRIAPNLASAGIAYTKEKGPASNRAWIHHFVVTPTEAESGRETSHTPHTAHTSQPPPEEPDAEVVRDPSGEDRTAGSGDRTPTVDGVEVPPREEASEMYGGCDVCDDPHPPSASPDHVLYTYISDTGALAEAVAALTTEPVIGLDFETAPAVGISHEQDRRAKTALDPHRGRARLLTLAAVRTFVVDLWACPGWPDIVRPLFADTARTIIGHNLKYDLRMALTNGLEVDAYCHDTMLVAMLIDSGASFPVDDWDLAVAAGKRRKATKRSYALAAVAGRALGVQVDKEEQRGDWSAESLRQAQIAYAATDAAILLPLYHQQCTELAAMGLRQVADIEAGCLPALASLEHHGLPFAPEAWAVLSDGAEEERTALVAELADLLDEPAKARGLLGGFAVDLDSPDELRKTLAAAGIDVPSTKEEVLIGVYDQHPAIPRILRYRDADKRAGQYGMDFVRKAVHRVTNRVHGTYGQLGTATGRMNCERENLQQIPHARAHRACFAPGPGRAFVKGDLSMIELRLAALIAPEPVMLAAFAEGADLHRRTAAVLLGIAEDAVTPEQRQLAKSVNFGLLYGMGARRLVGYAALHYGVQMTLEEAERYRARFFATYPGLRRWHARQPRRSGETRTLAGRRRVITEGTDEHGKPINIFSQYVNTPVSGSGADGLKLALARLWEHRQEAPSAMLIAAVHDEIDVECPSADAPLVAAWLRRHMLAAMEEIVKGGVPIEVEVAVGRDWAGSPLPGEGEEVEARTSAGIGTE